MSISLYDVTVPAYIRQLKNLSACLTKSEKWCADNGKPHSYLLEARLAPDMHSLPFQVRVATNMSRNGTMTADWAFVTSGARPEDENTFEGLHARIDRAVAFLETVKREDVEANAATPRSFWTGGAEGKGVHFNFSSGPEIVLNFASPNFWFHCSTAYDICRMQGVDLGKVDFLMGAFR